MVDLDAEYGPQLNRWHTGVPSIQSVIANKGNPAALGSASMFATVDLAKLSTAYTWVSESGRTGVPAASGAAFGAFEKIVKGLKDTPAGDLDWAKTAGGLGACVDNPGSCPDMVIDGLLTTFADVYMDAIAATPVLGWVASFVQLSISVGQTIWAENADAKPAPEMPLEADPFTDQAVGNQLLDLMRKDDWTDLFMPHHDPSGGGYINHVDVEFGTGYVGGRIQMANQGGMIAPMGHGLIPGGGVARLWQYRGKQASTGSTVFDRLARFLNLPVAAGEGFEDWTTYGLEYFQPAYEQISQLAWSMIQKPGPAMFRMDVARARPAWDQYWRLWLAGFYQMLQAGEKNPARVVNSALQPGATMFPDWPTWQTLAGYIAGPTVEAFAIGKQARETVGEKYYDLLSYNMTFTGKTLFLPGGVSWEEKQPVYGGKGQPVTPWVTNRGRTLRYLDDLEDSQHAALNRIGIAYMTGREPGLQGQGSAMWKHWHDRRIELLNHPDLRAVDLPRIPLEDYTGGGDWRRAVHEKRAKLGPGQIALARQAPRPPLLPAFSWGVGAPRTRERKPGQAPGKVPGTKMVPFAKPDPIDSDDKGAGLGLALLALLLGLGG